MPITKVRSGTAMEIVNLDRMAFNQAVADGHYPCAPATAKGSSRLFTEADLLGLFIFANLLKRGMLPRVAGPLACDFASEARLATNAGEDRLVHVRASGGSAIMGGSKYNPDHAQEDLGVVFDVLDIHVGNIRKIIASEI